MKKLAIVSSHPIQYNAPLFSLLSSRANIDIKVFYTWGESSIKEKFDPGFGKSISWDIPLLQGYNFEFLNNTSTQPGSHHFKGIINPDIINKINEYKPAAIMVYGWSFDSHLKVLKYFKNKTPIIFRGDSTLLDEPKKITLKKTLRRIFLKWVYTKINVALYCGQNNKQYFLKHNVKEKQLVFGPHTIDNKRFAGTQNLIDYRADLNIPKDDYVFLFVGKFENKKNPLLLLNSFLKLGKPNAHLVFVGNGVLENELKEQSKNNSQVHFLPFQNQSKMPGIYRLGNILVLPSKGPNETWGLAINEAMACGIPAIASTKVGCYCDLINENKNGFVFESNNEESLIEVLEKAYNSKINQQQFSQNALQKADEYSLEKLAQAIEKTVLGF